MNYHNKVHSYFKKIVSFLYKEWEKYKKERSKTNDQLRHVEQTMNSKQTTLELGTSFGLIYLNKETNHSKKFLVEQEMEWGSSQLLESVTLTMLNTTDTYNICTYETVPLKSGFFFSFCIASTMFSWITMPHTTPRQDWS